MKPIVRLIQILVIAAAAIFAVANRQDATLNLWPFPITLTMPVFVAVLGALAAGLVIGSGFASLSRIRSRLQVRSAQRRAKALERASAEATKRQILPALPARLSSEEN